MQKRESDFRQTVELIERHPIDHLHAFTCPECAGTSAAQESQVGVAERLRTRTAHRLGARKPARFVERYVGSSQLMHFEHSEGRRWRAWMPDHLQVVVEGEVALENSQLPVQLVEARSPLVAGGLAD